MRLRALGWRTNNAIDTYILENTSFSKEESAKDMNVSESDTLPLTSRHAGHGSRRHLLITGTGRAGTSFLVRYLTELGLDTHLARRGETAVWDDSAHAGLEDVPIAADPEELPYVIKSPWLAFNPEMIGDGVALDAIILPVRSLEEAAVSRVVIERQEIARSQPVLNDHGICSGSWGRVPGGIVYSLEPLDQARILAVALHRIVEYAVARDIPLLFLPFPRLVEDGAYLYDRLAHLLNSRITREDAIAAHARIADLSKVRTGSEMIAAHSRVLREAGLFSAPGSRELDRVAREREARAKAARDLDAAREEAAQSRRELEATQKQVDNLLQEIASERADVLAMKEQVSLLSGEISAIRAADLQGAALQARASQLEAELRAFRGSHSWRVTAPLRAVRRLFPRG